MSLIALQRDFRAWLTTEADEPAARFGEPARAGLDVYLNTYRGQLVACLAETFEQVRAWIGDEGFDAAAAIHIDRVPPSSWTLDAYARDFPETLSSLHPDDPEIAELAGIESALADAFVGPDTDPVSPADLAAIDWDRAALRFVPTMHILPAATNAAAIWSALAAGAMPPGAETLPGDAATLIWRSDDVACFRTVDAAEAAAIVCLRDGARFRALCAALVDAHGEADGAALAGGLLGQWISDGLIAAVTMEDEPCG